MTFHSFRTLGLCLLLFGLLSVTVAAQEPLQVLALPEAHAGEAYRVELEGVLREKYGLKLESGARTAIIQWALADGDLPAGISVRTDGTIIGQPETSRADAYRFRLKVVDVSAKSEELLLDFAIIVKAGRLRLSKIAGPRLVPIDMRVLPRSDPPSLGDGTLSTSDSKGSSNEAKDASSATNKDSAKPDPPVATIKAADPGTIQDPFSSMNKRFIVGFEQSGGASTESSGKPFFDLFINTPLSRSDADDKEIPRFSVWGDVRLTSTPEQVTALADVSSNAIGAITGSKLNQMSLGFDFLVGPEVRLAKFRHTDFGLIGAFGAVSPLSPKQSAQIFQVPDANSSQAAAFLKKYPGAQGKQFIAFTTPDRDRFLRQYFGGFRLRTFNYEGSELQNVFPATLDITFGQSEAVTGGRLHKFVVGIDGFYPLPFPDKSRFLYLFGTAKFKAGGPKTIGTPFILDTAASSVAITDPKVFLADPTTSNRDYFRIGFGVDLVELFRHNK